jgi:glutamine synthetase
MTPKDFFEFAKKNGAEMVDLKFVDLLGTWQHCTFPVDFLDEKDFKEGLGFDGSSIRGWKAIHQSDMMAVPDLSTVVMDPFFAKPTLSVIADVVDPLTREEYDRDPRNVAKKAAECIKKAGIADTKQAPGSLAEAIAALKADHKFLTEGGVFSEDLVETWIEWKQSKELDEIALRPHPHEFHLYYDC